MYYHSSTQHEDQGFTLIELLVVMAIIGILTSLIAGNFVSSKIKARDAKRKSDLAQIGRALELYNNDKGVYPAGPGGKIQGCGDGGSEICEWGSPFVDTKGTAATADDVIYMGELPADPHDESKNYFYMSDQRAFQLYAQLENEKDSVVRKDEDSDKTIYYGGPNCDNSGVIGTCNYGISSTNTTPEADRVDITH